MSSEPGEGGISDDSDEELPSYRAQSTPEMIPGFLERALNRLRTEPTDEDFTFEGVDFEIARGVWLAPIGAYDPDDDSPSTPDEVAAGASPTGPWGRPMLEWEQGVRGAMRASWGEPVLHTPRLVGAEQQPEGILDYLLLDQGFEQAELWDRGEHFVALITHWAGEPGASYLVQVLVLLPREYVMDGMGAMLDASSTEHGLLMHGEHPLELRRRAWLMSTIYGQGEVRLRDAALAGSRFSIRANDGTTTVWTFADDGRQLLLIQDPSCAFAEEAAGNVDSDERMLVMSRLLAGLPEDLLASVSARGETPCGEVAENPLEFGLLDGEPVPVVSGAFWFDGSTWHASRGLMTLGRSEGFGIDDYGFGAAVRKPYRLGGAFTVGTLAPPNNDARASELQRVFETCPYAEQPRPEGDVRLAYGIPGRSEREGIVDRIERATAAWWDGDPADAELGDDTFKVGPRALRGDAAEGELRTVLGIAEPWTADALQAWTNALADEMTERFGRSQEMRVHDPRTGIERRTPVTRVMRGTGLTQAPLWWVNGHGVLLLAGNPDPEYSDRPQTILVICRADALLELVGRSPFRETRKRARVISNLAAVIAQADGHVDTEAQKAATQPTRWNGPVLRWSNDVPLATRGGLRAGTFFWVWHFTHDDRGLLTSHQIGGEPGIFADRAALYEGVPEDLLSLVADADPAGPYPVVTRDGGPAGAGPLGSARTLPDAVAVFFYDGHDWRAPEGMLRAARARAEASGMTPLAALYSADVGVPQLQWALRADQSFSPRVLADADYARTAFSRPVTEAEAQAAFDRLGTPLTAALTGSLNDVLDVIVDGPGYRGLLDAALSNPDPAHRREIALWLLGKRADPSVQLSFMTPVNVLLANPTLDRGDTPVLRRLLWFGADPGFGLAGPRPGGHPLVQLCERDIDEAELEPLFEALLERDVVGEPVPRYDVTAPVLPDGRSLLEYVRAGDFPHSRSRARLLASMEGSG